MSPIRLFNAAALLTVTTLLTLLSGCASTTTVVTRNSTDTIEAPVSKLLLIGRVDDLEMRQPWEQACAKQLQHNGLDVQSSYKLWPQSLPEQEGLLQEASSQGFDGVLMAEIASLQLLPLQLPPDNVVSAERRPSSDASPRTPGFQIHVAGAEQSETLAQTQYIEFHLQRANGEALWNGLLSTNEANQVEAIARSQCKTLSKTLKKAGLLR